MEDIFINCIQCDTEFKFTAVEQEKYLRLGFDAPYRCPACRKNKIDTAEYVKGHKNKGKKKHYRFENE